MKACRFVVTAEHLRELLRLPEGAVVMRLSESFAARDGSEPSLELVVAHEDCPEIGSYGEVCFTSPTLVEVDGTQTFRWNCA